MTGRLTGDPSNECEYREITKNKQGGNETEDEIVVRILLWKNNITRLHIVFNFHSTADSEFCAIKILTYFSLFFTVQVQ